MDVSTLVNNQRQQYIPEYLEAGILSHDGLLGVMLDLQDGEDHHTRRSSPNGRLAGSRGLGADPSLG